MWEPRYLAGPQGVGLIQALHDVSRLIGRGSPARRRYPSWKCRSRHASASAGRNPYEPLASRRALKLLTGGDKARRNRRIVGWTALLLGVLMVIAAAAPMLRLLGTAPCLIYRPQHQRIPVAAVMLSGDIGFRTGMSAPAATSWRRPRRTLAPICSLMWRPSTCWCRAATSTSVRIRWDWRIVVHPMRTPRSFASPERPP